MYTKLLTLLALASIARSNDVIVGLRTDGRKFFDENRQANPALWRQMDNVTVRAPENEVISRIVITDLRPEKDGDVKVVEGGEGQHNVTVELKSPTVLRGYEFHIEVFSTPDRGVPFGDDQLSTTDNVQGESAKSTGASTTYHETTSKLPDSSTKLNVPAILIRDEETKDSAREGRNAKNEDISTEGATEVTSTTFKSDVSSTQQTGIFAENQSEKPSDVNKDEHQAPVPKFPLNRNINVNPSIPAVTGSDITSNKDNNDAKDESRHARDTEAEKSGKSTDNKVDLTPTNLHLFDATTEHNEASTTEMSDEKPIEEKSADKGKEDGLNPPRAYANDFHKFTSIIPSKNNTEKVRSARDANEEGKNDESSSTTESGESTTGNSKEAESTTSSSEECVTSQSEEQADGQSPLNTNQDTKDKVYINDGQWNPRWNNPRFQSLDIAGRNDQKTADKLSTPAVLSQSTISPQDKNAEPLETGYNQSPDHLENKNPKISAISGFKGN